MLDFKCVTFLVNARCILILALVIFLLKYVTKKYSRNPQWINFSKKLPGPYAFPIVGNNFNLLHGGRNGFGSLFCKYLSMYGPRVRLWISQNLAVLLSDVKDVEAVLSNSNCLEKGEITEVFSEFFGSSLIMASPAAVWKHKRKHFQPFFSKNSSSEHIPQMNALIYQYIEKMKKVVDGPEFDVGDVMNDLSFDTITKTHLNFAISDRERKELNIYHHLTRSFERLSLNWFCPWYFIQVLMNFLHPVDPRETKKHVFKFIDKILELNRESKEIVEEVEKENEPTEPENFVHSYLSALEKAKEELNEHDLVHFEILLLFIAGTDTTGTTMAFCLLALAANPHIQEKMYREIYQIFGDDNRPAEKSDFDKIPYLDQVIKETQRLFTIVPAIVRSVFKDTKVGDHIYPAGTMIMINIAGIHHNPELYANPYRFNPDNFSPEAVKKRHKCSFLAFSAGARNCLGKDYAEQSMKLRLIALLRTFSFHTSMKLEDMKFKVGIMENSAIGYPVSVKLRKKIG